LTIIKKHREFLRTNETENVESDQQKGIAPPPLQLPYPREARLIDLVPSEKFSVGKEPVIDAIRNRRSRRQFSGETLTKEELSFLLWAIQGVQRISEGKINTLRSVPSAGARHPFETYLVINRAEEFQPGLYRYLPLDHKVYLVSETGSEFLDKLDEATFGQKFIGESAVVFVWTVVPYRTEWRYPTWAHKLAAIDMGHVCQNLYLACESINIGTCAVAAYDQQKMDALLGVSGEEEFVVYLAPVGKRIPA
jgi:SagB-type dehydrogenase family enzyme